MSIKTLENDIIDGIGLGGWQVILFNDNHNTLEHVVVTLMSVFSHDVSMAQKIAIEAHKKGRTIAQVEDEDNAVRHTEQINKAGIGAEVQKI